MLVAAFALPVLFAAGRLGLAKAYSFALVAHSKGDYAFALPIIAGGALLNDPAACSLLGTVYLFGQGVAPDGRRAEYWLSKAAEGGIVEAQSLLGIMYATGQGVPRNLDRAIHFSGEAAAHGDSQSIDLLRRLRAGQGT